MRGIGVTSVTRLQCDECFVIVLFIQICALKVWCMGLGVHNVYLCVKLFTFANIFPDVKLWKKTFHIYSVRWALFFRLWYVTSFENVMYNVVNLVWTSWEIFTQKWLNHGPCVVNFRQDWMKYAYIWSTCWKVGEKSVPCSPSCYIPLITIAAFLAFISTNITFPCEPHGMYA